MKADSRNKKKIDREDRRRSEDKTGEDRVTLNVRKCLSSAREVAKWMKMHKQTLLKLHEKKLYGKKQNK